MDRRRFLLTSLAGVLAAPVAAGAQQPARVYRIGVLMGGGPYLQAIDGLRDGLRELGLQEGPAFVLRVHDAGGELKAVAAAAKIWRRRR